MGSYVESLPPMAYPLIFTALLCLPLCFLYRYMKRRELRLLPGPTGLPLIGNMLDIPSPHAYPWVRFHRMCRESETDILRLSTLGVNVIVIDALEPAVELLDKRSSIYSDRPRMVMLNELAGFGWNFASMPYGTEWRECRKMAHREFNANSLKKYRPVLLRNAHDLLKRLGSARGTLPQHLQQVVGANIMDVTYGIKVLPEHDPFIELAEAGQECIGRSRVGGLHVVDLMPFLKYMPPWFPGAGFKRLAGSWRQAAEAQLHVAYDDFLGRMNEGKANPCMALSLVEDHGTDSHLVNSRMRAATATMYMGGAETTAASLHTFFLAMAMHPDVQARAREELDKCVGLCRLPTFDDCEKLPYMNALVKEVIRWYPIIPILFPHRLTTDDTYRNFLLEKGSFVLVNTWAILHDEKHYVDPFAFKPDRFLKNGTFDPDVLDPAEVAFGYGRRICPGIAMAHDGLLVMVASVLACFTIGKATRGDGGEIDLDEDFVSRTVCEPKPFLCDIRPRSDAHLALFADND